MLTGFRGRVVVLLVAAILIGGAVGVRVWLAATSSYSNAPLAMPLRVGSGVALAAGLILSIAAMVWPVPRKPNDKKEGIR